MLKIWNKFSIPSPVVLCLPWLALMLFSLYISKTIFTRRNLNMLQRLIINRFMFLEFAFFWHFFSICNEVNNHVSMMIYWRQMHWNIICYHTFKFSCQFRLVRLSDQTSFCKIKASRWDFIAHENLKIKILQASIVNMT